MKNLILIFLGLVVFNSCNRDKLVPPYIGLEDEDFTLPFNVNVPDTLFEMKKKLNEISGLTWAGDNAVYAINDEKGDLYKISVSTGEILDKFDFGKNNDYEGLTKKDSLIYIAESNGNITVVDLVKRDKVEEYKTYLSKRNDVEGLCLTKDRSSLLLACKAETEKDKSKYEKGFYKFNLDSNKLEEKASLKFELRDEVAKLSTDKTTKNVIIDLSFKKRLSMFGPSGVDVDPISGLIYSLSNRGKLLVVSNSNNKIKGVYFLGNRTYGQPEGLCFDPLGNLYISNEARSRKANILVIKRKNITKKDDISPLEKLIPNKKDTK